MTEKLGFGHLTMHRQLRTIMISRNLLKLSEIKRAQRINAFSFLLLCRRSEPCLTRIVSNWWYEMVSVWKSQTPKQIGRERRNLALYMSHFRFISYAFIFSLHQTFDGSHAGAAHERIFIERNLFQYILYGLFWIRIRNHDINGCQVKATDVFPSVY